MVRIIDLKLRSSKTILNNDDDIFSDIAERRENVLRDLRDQFERFITTTESFTDESLFPDKYKISPNLAAGSAAAAIGVAFMTLSSMSVFDITGGILTTVGVLFAGFSTRSKRRKIVDGFRQEVEKGRNRLSGEVNESLKSYIVQLKKRIDDNFLRFDDHLQREGEQLSRIVDEQKAIDDRLSAMRES